MSFVAEGALARILGNSCGMLVLLALCTRCLMERLPAATAAALPWSATFSPVKVWFRTPWTIAASVVSSVSISLLLYAFFQRPALGDILALGMATKPGPDYWLLPASVIATTIILLMPVVSLTWLLILVGRRYAAERTFVGGCTIIVAAIMVDLDLMRSIGRHLFEVAEFASQPHAHVAAGGAWGWALLVLKRVCTAFLGTLLASALCRAVTAYGAQKLSRLLRGAIGGGGLVAVVMAVPAPTLLLAAWGNHPLVERLYGSSLVDIRPGFALADDPTPSDPRLVELYARMRKSYKAAYPAFVAGKPADANPVRIAGRPPNVILVVAESLRHDVFGEELMPRLSRWAEEGLIAARHEAGTVYSQSGAFALLYGRSPAAYHQTLDAHVPPQFCVTLRESGYQCAFFTGHPKEWLRREEFLNERTMDHFVHDDRGTWPDWDQRALGNMVQFVERSDGPVFATVLLMSSHFEYQYPPEYEIDRPVSSSQWTVTAVKDLGPEAQRPHRNRYRNTMRFLDDAVADAIARLEPQRNLIIFTGDHGESIYDDGHYTHGYSFADILTRTPFAMVGPGVSPARLEKATSHIDVLPSVLHVLTGQPQPVKHLHGADWFTDGQRASVFAAHSPPGKREVQALLKVHGKRLRFDMDLTRPSITLLGFEDELARLLPTPDLSPNEVAAIASAFEEQLSILRQ